MTSVKQLTVAEFPTYEEYKDSGVEWLGEVPKEWVVKRFSDSFKFDRGLNITKANLIEEGVPCINYGEVHSKYGFEFSPTNHPLKAVELRYLETNRNSLLYQGDFIFADTSEDLEGSGNFSQLVADEQVFAGYHSIICRPTGIKNKRFLAYCLESISFRNQIRQQVKGVKVYSITQSILKNTKIWLPSEPEQALIAQFLDQKTALIDQAIAIKKQQIKLLNERKQIIIQQAVTQGLNPNAPMKDSGVEWIGKIPEHWEVKKAKYLFYEVDERSTTGAEELLSVSHTTGVTPRSEKNVNMFLAENYAGSKLCEKHDLVMNTMWAWMGALGVSKQIGIVSPSYAVYRQKQRGIFNDIYLEYLLKSTKYVELYNKVSTGLHSSRLRFYSHKFFSMKIGFPSYEEQTKIVAYLQKSTKKVEHYIEHQKQQIQALKEYRTTLINSAVTGKIKITEAMLAETKE